MFNFKTYARSSAALLVLAVGLAGMTPALAGEITGNGKSLKNEDGTLNGKSLCAYSGQNDSPNGFILPNGTVIDPGGDIQSYGYFKSHFDDFIGDPSDPENREKFGFPAVGCNPSTSAGH
jgi:hypothetical protein